MSDSLFTDSDLPRQAREILPGVIHLPGWLDVTQQLFLVRQFQLFAQRGIPPHSPDIFGKKMSVQMTSLGWHWSNYEYTQSVPELGGAAPLPVPDWIVRLGRRAVEDAYARPNLQWPVEETERTIRWARSYTPDMALVNYYSPQASMGMHQDKEERSSAPIVSLSIGDTAIFRAGNTETKNHPYIDLRLASGDLVVFGGPSRFMYHGVPKILAGTAPTDIGLHSAGLTEGRFNLTLRDTGLAALATAGLPLK